MIQDRDFRSVARTRLSGDVKFALPTFAGLALVLLFVATPQQAWAQADEIHYIPPFHAYSDVSQHYLLVSTVEAGSFDVTVRDGAGNLVHTFTGLTRSTPQEFNLPGGGYAQIGVLEDSELNAVSTEGLILTADQPFTSNVRHRTTDQGLSLTSKGQFALGTEFRSGHLISNNEVANSKANFLSVMATEDGTSVTFSDIPAGFTFLGQAPGSSLPVVSLDAGESYVVSYTFDHLGQDLTNDPNEINGVHVTSDKPIAFTTGSWLGGNAEGNRKDIGVDQTVPVDRLGTEFVVLAGAATTRADLLERPGVVAATDDTEVFAGGVSVGTIDAGEHLYIPASFYGPNGNMFIETSAPAFLYQSTSSNDANGNGMSFIPPLRCNGTSEVVIGNTTLVGASSLGIVARAGATVSINGVALTGPGDSVVGTSDWVTYEENVTGDVDVTSDDVINVSLVTNAGDRGSAGYFTGFADAPSVSVVGDTDLCQTSPITIEAAATVGIDSFRWFKDTVEIAGETGSSLSVSMPGSYTVLGVLKSDTSDTCSGGETSQSPPVVVTIDCECGDNTVDALEECDDGNTAGNDGCSPVCLFEFCGDGVTNNGTEECDDGNTTAGDGCDASCVTEFCGDSITNNGTETCDDGNTAGNDGCGPTCQTEFCGDTIVNNGTENCDDGNTAGNDGCGPTCQTEFCGDTIVNNGTEECDDGNTAADDGCGPTCLNEVCGDSIVNGSEECDDGNTADDDGCDGSCVDEFCGDGLINDNGEECDDANANDGDGCDSGCTVEPGFQCMGEPSVCLPNNPEIDQLFLGSWPAIDMSSRYVIFVSPEDVNNDGRILANNADGNDEVFVLGFKKPKKKNGPGRCLGGINNRMSCKGKRDCPGSPPVKFKPCSRISQLTDTVGAGSPFTDTAIGNGGRGAAYVDATGGPTTAVRWNRKTFEKSGLAAALADIGVGARPRVHPSGKFFVIESTQNFTGDNLDGNSEIFLYNAKKDVWTQITDTVSPVENRRPIATRFKRIVFDSNGDLDNVSRTAINNADGSREIYFAKPAKSGPSKIVQRTDTADDLFLGCSAKAGNMVFVHTQGDLHNDVVGPPLANVDGNFEIFRWRRQGGDAGSFLQITESVGGENVNADCTQRGRLVSFESTSDLDSDGSSNRRVYLQSVRTRQRVLMSPSSTGDSVRPRMSREKVVFASTSDLAMNNPGGDSYIYIFDPKVLGTALVP